MVEMTNNNTAPLSLTTIDITPPRMLEAQTLHRYTDVTYQSNAGAIAEELISVRPSLYMRLSLQSMAPRHTVLPVHKKSSPKRA